MANILEANSFHKHIGPNPVSNYKSLFDLCDKDAKRIFFNSLIPPDDPIFNVGPLKVFPLNDQQTLKECELTKKSPLMYPLYVFCDIGGIIIWLFTLGKKCNDDFFCTTKELYRYNDDIDRIIDKIREYPTNVKPAEPNVTDDINNPIIKQTNKDNMLMCQRKWYQGKIKMMKLVKVSSNQVKIKSQKNQVKHTEI